MDNFNLRGFLTENKLTGNSKQIKEGGYDNTEEIGDLYQAEIEQYLGISGKNYRDNKDLFNKATDIYNAMYDADLMDSTDSNFIYDQVEEFIKANMPELANQSGEVSEEENGGTFFKATVNLADKPGVDYGYTLHAQDEEGAKAELASKLQGQEYQLKDLKGPFTPQPKQGEISSKVDKSTIELDGVDSSDYPDFVDAFISAANFEDGTPLTDDELDQLGDEMSDEIHQMAYDSLMEGLSEREKTLKEEVLKALK